MIVSDAGPIIIFARIGRLSLLRQVTGSLTIPDAVHDEIVVKKGGMPGAAEVASAVWIQRAVVSDRATLDRLPPGLHAGEREAIALAKERGAQLLIDEIRARRVAMDQKIDVIGTLRILSEAQEGAESNKLATPRVRYHSRSGSLLIPTSSSRLP